LDKRTQISVGIKSSFLLTGKKRHDMCVVSIYIYESVNRERLNYYWGL